MKIRRAAASRVQLGSTLASRHTETEQGKQKCYFSIFVKIRVFTKITADESGSNQHERRISKLSYARKFLDHYFLSFCFTKGPSKLSVLLRTIPTYFTRISFFHFKNYRFCAKIRFLGVPRAERTLLAGLGWQVSFHMGTCDISQDETATS